MIREVELKIVDSRASVPTYATEDSGAVDLIACLDKPVELKPLSNKLIPTGLHINMQNIPEHCVAMILPRSGKGHKEGKVLGNLVGLIDQDYQGQLMVSLWNRNSEKYVTIEPGERFAQLVFVPIIRAAFKVVEEFSSKTVRGEDGFGSTGS